MKMTTCLLNFVLGGESEGRVRLEARTQGKMEEQGTEVVWFSVEHFYNKYSLYLNYLDMFHWPGTFQDKMI